jgi:hypothetical protein
MVYKKKKEKYDGDDGGRSSWKTIVSIFWGMIAFVAIYYSFVINKGFKWGPFLLALVFSPIYLVWGIYKAGIPPTVKINR